MQEIITTYKLDIEYYVHAIGKIDDKYIIY